MTDYRVKTDIYNGPMDLLLYLIRRDEIDIYDIPIARVTEQYCRYVETLQIIDPNVAGDFLVLAATLMEIKSRMLLPRAEAAEGEADDLGDPRLELVRQLLEYKRFKDASFELHDAARRQAMRWPRMPAAPARRDAADVDLEDVQIWDLVAAFNKLMAAIGAGVATHEVVFDDTPIALHAADVLDRLQREGGELDFEQVFVGRNKVEMIGLFLALLELIRQQRVRVTQAGMFGPIRIILLSAEPIEVGEEPLQSHDREGQRLPTCASRADTNRDPTSRDRTSRDRTSRDRTSRDRTSRDRQGAESGMSGKAAALDTAEAEADGGPSGAATFTSRTDARHECRGSGVDADDDTGEDDLDDWEGFEELSRIKTEVDIDEVLREGSPSNETQDEEHEQP